MSTQVKNTIAVDRGNNKTIKHTVYQVDGETAYDLTGCEVTLYVKTNIKDDNDDAIITLVGTLTNAENGKVEFYLLPTHTNSDAAKANLKDDKNYPYEVEVVTGDTPTKYYTSLRSIFTIKSQNR